MARKVFISVLGTGFYNSGKYSAGDFVSSETRFIQQATLEQLHVDQWSAGDKVCILLTDVARQRNWEIPSGEREDRNGTLELYKGLKDSLKDMAFKPEICDIRIPDGNNTPELWEIFDAVFNIFEEGDEVYFDITHGFRYLPMLVIVLGNYSKFLKHINIRSITYGNYEGRDKSTGFSPITDLLPLSILQDWTNAASDFLENGNITKLKGLCQQEIRPILKETKGKDESANVLRGLMTFFPRFMEEIKFCRGKNLNEGINAEKTSRYVDRMSSTVIKPLNPLLDKIKEVVDPYNDTANGLNCVKAASTCFNFGLYQTAVTFLQEGIVTFFCLRHGIDCYDEKRRGLVNVAFKKALAVKQGKLDNYRRETDEAETLIDEIINDDYLKDSSLVDDFANLSDVRNDFNHSGLRTKSMTPDRLKENIQKCIESASRLFVGTKGTPQLASSSKVFINFSNHPYSEWSEEQKAAAKAYGTLEEVPFPAVSPDYDESDISDLADEYVGKIKKQIGERTATVHIMGETGLCFMMAGRLMNHGIRCVYSTTTRDVTANADGTKNVSFDFKKFREYDG